MKNIVGGIAGVIVIIYFPFTLQSVLTISLPAELLADADIFWWIQNADLVMRAIIGITTVISFLSALYDVFKFGSWKASDRKSLI